MNYNIYVTNGELISLVCATKLPKKSFTTLFVLVVFETY